MTVISRFTTDTYEVTRTTEKGKYVNGFYQPGLTETIQVDGSLQPLNPREIKQVEEGYRLKQLFKFYTDQPIVTISSGTLAEADKIKINGETYKVLAVESWDGTDLPYFRSTVVREPENQ